MAFHKYASDAEIVSDKLPNVNTAADLLIVGRLNEAVSALVDSYCERKSGAFLPASDTSTIRYVRGEGRNFLRLPIHVAGTVSVLGIAATQFYESEESGWLYEIDDESATPAVDTTFPTLFELNYQYHVTARWGYDATPAEIIEAAKQIVGRWFEATQGVLGEVTPDGFVIERDAPKSAILLLDRFKRREYEII